MNLMHTDENFTGLPSKEKINLVKALANGEIEEVTVPGLNITVLIDGQGNHTLTPNGEVIDLADLKTIENYLKAKYPLSNIFITEVMVDDAGNETENTKAA